MGSSGLPLRELLNHAPAGPTLFAARHTADGIGQGGVGPKLADDQQHR